MSERSIVLHAVGDIALGDHPLCTGFGTHSRCRTRAPAFPFERIAGAFRGADIVFGNLECTLSQSGLRTRDYHSAQMRGHPAYLDGLKQAGFDMLNVANNHSMQHGKGPFRDTVQMLRAAGIGVCGVSEDSYRRAVPEVIEKNGLRIAFLGYSLRPRQYFTEEPLYTEGYPDEIVSDVRRARMQHDCVVVSLHWGDEFIDRPAPQEIGLAHAIVDAGASLIIGHHPHVLRGVEQYGHGYIAYSLGNFVCDMLWDETLRETAIVQCRVTPEGIADFRLVPVRINDDYQPTLLEAARAEKLSARIRQLSERLQGAGATSVPRESAAQYQDAAHQAHRLARAKSHRYFLMNAYRFPPGIVIQQLTTYLRNRLAERGLAGKAPSQSSC